jgi:glycosyltransferase involved in cell wall biosynthesis
VRIVLEIEGKTLTLARAAYFEKKSFVVVGIPAYNEEKTIAELILQAQKYSNMVVVCDDGSSDMTAEIAKRLGADVVQHGKNLGYGAAIKSLFVRAWDLGADVLVTLDADGQHDPNEIPNVVKPIFQEKADVVIGSRFIGNCGASEMPFYRKVGTQLITKLINGSSKKGISDAQSGFRAYNRKALEFVNISEAGMGASVEILLKATKQDLKICEVPSSCRYNNGDIATSTHNPLTHGVSVIMSIVKFVVEEKPLMLLGIPGLLCLFTGFVFGVWMLQIYAIEQHIVTNIALASVAFVLIGFFLLSTAITLYAIKRIAKR